MKKADNNSTANSNENTNPVVTYTPEASNGSIVETFPICIIPTCTCKSCGILLEKVYHMDNEEGNRYSLNLVSKRNPKDSKQFFMGALRREPYKLTDILNMTGNEDLDVHDLLADISEQYKSAPITLCNSKIGLDQYDGQTVYRWDGVIGVDNKSRYVGKLPLGAEGSKGNFLELVKKFVISKPHLSLMMILAIYGVLLDIIAAKHIPVRGGTHDLRITANFTGDSSIGKTSSTLVAASVAGQPSKMLETFNNTDLKLVEKMSAYAAIPLIIDEFTFGSNDTRSERQKKLRLLFMLHSGKQRGRVNLHPSLIKRESPDVATNAVIVSTELSILKTLGEQEVKGHRARLLEIPCGGNDFFDNGEDCEMFAEGISVNYGWGEHVIRHILSSWSDEKFGTTMNAHCSRIEQRIDGSSLMKRFAKRIALIRTTGEAINEAFKINLDLNGVEELLISSIKAADRKSYPDLAYEQLCSYIRSYPDKFCTSLDKLIVLSDKERKSLAKDKTTDQEKQERQPDKESCLGAFLKEDNVRGKKYDAVLYTHGIFLDEIIDGKYMDAIRVWRDNGTLLSAVSKNVLTRKHIISNRRCGLYEIKIKLGEQ